MKTIVILNVLRDVFMAVETQTALAGSVKRNVAGGALGLEVGMSLDEIPWHDQRLNSLSSSIETCETGEHYDQSC